MYSLHRLAWGAAHEQNRDEEQAEDLVRRCEVVIAGTTGSTRGTV
jgi:hypothetical protein